MSLVPFLHRVASGESLSSAEAYEAMNVLLEGNASEAAMAGFLVALRMKGETASELAGFARAMLEKVVFIDGGPDVIDIVGTGGDGAGTFNISTVAAIVMAGAGAHVAKHGNRAISGSVGSPDVFETLGVRVARTPEEAVHAVREIGLGFLFAPHLHPAMKYAQAVRRELKIRTVFNLLGPLANPARAQMQVIGAPSPEAAKIMAEALSELGTRRSFVVHGHDGLDEISTTSSTDVYEVWTGRVEKHIWTPEDFGVPRTTRERLAGGSPVDNARITRAILGGESGARRDIVVVNAAAGLLAGGLAKNPREGVAKAAESIDCGNAGAVLKKLKNKFPVF